MSAAVESLKALLHDQPAVPLKPKQIREYHDEERRLTQLAGGIDMEGQARTWIPRDQVGALKRIKQVRASLAREAPREITDGRRDKVAQLMNQVIDAEIRPALQPQTVMRRNPAGAVGQYRRAENSPGVKDAILTVRRAGRALEPLNDDPDFVNMERFRPSGVQGDTGTFMANAMNPGNFAFGARAKANWPLGEPTADTAIKQAARANGGKKPLSDKQRAALDRMHAGRRAKRATAQGAEPTALTSSVAEG